MSLASSIEILDFPVALVEQPAAPAPVADAPAVQAEVWHRVCPLDALEPWCGEAALVAGREVALVRIGDTVHAVDHVDPHTGAPVMARGIVGSRAGATTIASPLHKEVYDLATGARLDGEGSLGVHRVRVRHEHVFVMLNA